MVSRQQEKTFDGVSGSSLLVRSGSTPGGGCAEPTKIVVDTGQADGIPRDGLVDAKKSLQLDQEITADQLHLPGEEAGAIQVNMHHSEVVMPDVATVGELVRRVGRPLQLVVDDLGAKIEAAISRQTQVAALTLGQQQKKRTFQGSKGGDLGLETLGVLFQAVVVHLDGERRVVELPRNASQTIIGVELG